MKTAFVEKQLLIPNLDNEYFKKLQLNDELLLIALNLLKYNEKMLSDFATIYAKYGQNLDPIVCARTLECYLWL